METKNKLHSNKGYDIISIQTIEKLCKIWMQVPPAEKQILMNSKKQTVLYPRDGTEIPV